MPLKTHTMYVWVIINCLSKVLMTMTSTDNPGLYLKKINFVTKETKKMKRFTKL